MWPRWGRAGSRIRCAPAHRGGPAREGGSHEISLTKYREIHNNQQLHAIPLNIRSSRKCFLEITSALNTLKDMRAGCCEIKLEIRNLSNHMYSVLVDLHKHPHLNVFRDFANFVCKFQKGNTNMFEKCICLCYLEAGQTGAVERGPEVGAEAAVPTRARLAFVHLSLAPDQYKI